MVLISDSALTVPIPLVRPSAPADILPDGLVELLPTAAYVCDRDGLIVQFNSKAAELWGRRPLLGDPSDRFCGAYRIFRPDGTHVPHELCPMAGVLEHGIRVRDEEVVIERSDGSRITAVANIDPIYHNGVIVGAINCFLDITARKTAEDELRENKRDLDDFFDNATVPMHWVDSNGTIIRANRAEMELLGFAPDEYVGRHISEFHADQDAISEILTCLSRGQSLDKYPARLRGKDGSIKHVLISSNAQFRDGRFVHTRCISLDVTREQQAEEKRRKEEERSRQLAAIIESSGAAIFSVGLDSRIDSWNKAAERLYGYGAADVHGKPIQILIPEERETELFMLERVRNGERIAQLETLRRRKDGALIEVSVTISPVSDSAGRVVGISEVARDITRRRRAEAALARRLEEQAALYEFTDRLQHTKSLDEIYDAALEAITRALTCERASILLFDHDDVMRFVAWKGLSAGYRQAVDGHTPWTVTTTDPQAICIDDIDTADLDDSLRATVKAEGIGALAFIPVSAAGRLTGKFMAYYDAPHEFAEAEVSVAMAIARQLGFAVERVRAEEARRVAEQELRASEAREAARAAELETIMEAVPAVIWTARDSDCRSIQGNRASFEFLRLDQGSNQSLSAPDSERPSHFQVFAAGRVLAPEELPVQRAARGEEVRNFEEEVRFNDGTSRWLIGNAVPLRNADGIACGSVAAFVDITDRKKAEEQRDLVVAELSHRVKNTLSIVISIARQTFAQATDLKEGSQSFEARIRALAQTHSQLAETSWSGVPFEAILLGELAPYRSDDGGNVRLSGPALTLLPKCALALGMGIHELTTNAAKYGALSQPGGRIAVSWRIDRDRDELGIEWEESGGPPVGRPRRYGFGRLLLEQVLSSDVNGTVLLDFAPRGLKCAIAVPLAKNVVEQG